MIAVFQLCNELEYLDLYNFNTSNVIDMGYMFNECHKLKEIKGINNFNTSKVTKMNSMFQECYELEYLDLSNFNTSNAIDIGYMFNECYKLKEIKGISNFDLTNIRNKNKIFDGCNFLNQLIFLIFHSADYSIYFFIPCYKSDNFTTVEEKLFDKYPELQNKQIYFTINGIIINKSETLEKNNIKISAYILVNFY